MDSLGGTQPSPRAFAFAVERERAAEAWLLAAAGARVAPASIAAACRCDLLGLRARGAMGTDTTSSLPESSA